MAKRKRDPNQSVTMKDLDEVVRAILAGTKGLINNLRLEMKAQFKKTDDRFNKIEVGRGHLKDQIDGLKADLSVAAPAQAAPSCSEARCASLRVSEKLSAREWLENEVPIPSALVMFRQIQEHVFPTAGRLHLSTKPKR